MANGLSEASGAKVPVEDVVPLTADDPTGAGLTALALPLVFGGIMPAVVLVQLFPRSIVKRVLGAAGVAVVAGFALTAILQFGTNSLDGNYLLTALGLTMGMSAISLPILGLESLLGMKGFALGAVTMMFIGNPLSGMATTAAWLPAGWGALGQLLPPGAAGASVRSMAFFDGHGATTPLLVLVCWIAVGIALCVAAGRKKASARLSNRRLRWSSRRSLRTGSGRESARPRQRVPWPVRRPRCPRPSVEVGGFGAFPPPIRRRCPRRSGRPDR